MEKSGGGVGGRGNPGPSPKASLADLSPHNTGTGSKGYQKSTAGEVDDPNRIWEDLPKHLRIKKRMAYIRRHSDLTVSSKYRRFKLLMWKNYIVTKRRWKTSLLQFLSPTFFVTLLVIFVSNVSDSGYDDQIFDYFDVDSIKPEIFHHCTTLYIMPQNPATSRFREHLESAFGDDFKYDFLDKVSTMKPAPTNLCALLQFPDYLWEGISNETFPTMISYDLRFPAVHDSNLSRQSLTTPLVGRWDTAFRYPTYLVDGAREPDNLHGGHPGYYEHGFLYIQHKIAMEFLEIVMFQEGSKISNETADEWEDELWKLLDKMIIRLRRFPFPAHESEETVQTISTTLPTFLVIGFAISCVVMSFFTVREKEMGIRTLVQMYGIEDRYHRYAWILHNCIFQSIFAILMSIILSTTWTNTRSSAPLFEDEFLGQVFFMLMVSYIFNLVCTVTLLVCFFSRTNTACISVCFIATVSYLPYIYLKRIFNILTFWEKFCACLPANAAIGIGCLLIAELQAEGNVQLSWSDIFRQDGEFCLGWVMLVLLVMGILQLLISNYLSRVIPGNKAQKLPWNFLFKSWFWNSRLPPAEEVPKDKTQEKSFEENHPEYFEDDSNTKQRKELCIENISKYLEQHRILHKVNLLCYQGHVSVLLGNQGSGKSTLMRIVCGTMAPSVGTVYLSRKDLFKNPIMARAFVGYCPSEDLLFPDLTVDETLQFFTDLKGVSNRIEAYEEVERFLKITSLADFRETRVCELTKSSQRMLMVATAFCGGSRVVLLDDPTLNLSASQQRVLWDFAAQEKKHRTILCAMDLCHEVDSVVDKIILLHYGQVTAKGSPEFLRDKFGGGYHLELEVKGQFDQEALFDLIKRRVAGGHLFKARGRILDFYLPQSQSASFPGVLEELESVAESYGVAEFAVKYVTLEELHLRLKRKSTHLEDLDPRRSFVSSSHHVGVGGSGNVFRRNVVKKSSSKSPRRDELKRAKQEKTKSSGMGYGCREFKVMFMKNLKFSFRHTLLFVTAIVATLILLTISILLTKTLELRIDSKAHVLNYTDYKDPFIISDIYRSTNEGSFMRASVRNLFSKKYGIQRKNVAHDENMVTAILKDYNRAENEKDVSLLGIEILPVKIPGCNYGKDCVKVGVTGYFNNQPLHTPAVALAMVHNVLMDHLEEYISRVINESYEKQGYHINVSNHPLTYQPADYVKHSQVLIGPGNLFGVTSSFCYASLIASYIIMHIKEQDFRHMQMVFGVNKFVFWFSNYLWNMIHFSVVAIIHVLILAILGVPGFPSKWNNWGERLPLCLNIFVFLEIYGFTGVCMVGSCASFSFQSWGRGFSKLVMFMIITGPLTMMIMIPAQAEFSKDNHPSGYTVLHNIAMIFPSYAFGNGLYQLVANENHKRECGRYEGHGNESCDPNFTVHPFNEFEVWDGNIMTACCYNKRATYSFVAYGIGRNVFFLLFVAFICICQKIFSHSKRMRLLMKKLLDRKVQNWRPLILNEHEIRDYDVLAETAKIYSGEDSHELTIKNLTLETPVYVKLDNICLEVRKGECFAFLGALGSGKSTFLKILSGYQFIPTYGDVEYKGLSLLRDYDKYIKAFSYSPDRNPFLNELTGEEILLLMGTLRGMSFDAIEEYVAHWGDNLGMSLEMEEPVKTYSFVQVKKLCIAVAMLGKFEVLLLDNPTHHMDPKSRKFIMNNVRKLMEDGCIVVWASHGIEHCETICSKMSILVNGHLKCIGSLDHLRKQYEEGYTIIVRFVLDKDMIYFTSKKNIQMENEIRNDEVDEEKGAAKSGPAKQQERLNERQKNLRDTFLEDDIKQALAELAPWEQDLCPFVAYFERSFPESILVDKQPGFIHYHVHKNKTTWSELFRKMEEAKVVADVDSYYITTTNLDQVFFNFTRGQVTFDLESYTGG